MTLQEQVVLLRAEKGALSRQLTMTEARIAELEGRVRQKALVPPPHVKPNRAKLERAQTELIG